MANPRTRKKVVASPATKRLDLSSLESRFALIENEIKKTIGSPDFTMNEASLPIIQLLVNQLDALSREFISDVYLLSVSLLIDDFYQITFAEGKQNLTAQWDRHAFKSDKGGIIADCCNKHEVSSFTKQELLAYHNISQREDFLISEVQLYSVAPVFIGETNIGCIILSLKKRATNEVKERVESLLSWLGKKVEWILYTEYIRINGLLEKCMFLHNALDCVDEYQSYHSLSVSKLAYMFGFIINKQRTTYAKAIRRSYPDFEGVDLFRIRLIGLTHDIGKVTMSEFEDFNTELDQCKRSLHPYFSYSVLSKCGLPDWIAEAAGNHHESIMSDGYPFGLALGEERTSVESQIVKFADIIDSSIRERDHSLKTYREEQFVRASVEVAKEAVMANKEQFNADMFEVLIGILSGLIGGEYAMMFYMSFMDSIKLTGMANGKEPDEVKLEIGGLPIDFTNLGRNKWAIIYASNARLYQETTILKGMHIGLCFDECNKEFAYGFCEHLFNNWKRKKPLVCAFISHSISRSNDFGTIVNSCLDKMAEYLASAPKSPKRWRLLRFDEHSREWK